MKATIAKNQLVKAIEFVSLANYKTDEADDTISISCDSYTVALTGANAENNIEIVLEAEVEEPGYIVIEAKNLDKQLKGFGGTNIVLTGNDDYIFFETEKSVEEYCNMKIMASETKKFLDFRSDKNAVILTCNSGILANALAAASIAVDKKSPKEELKNVGVIMTKDKISFVGFSSTRLSVFDIDTNGTNKMDGTNRFTIPLNAAKNIAKMFKKGKNDITVCLEKNNYGHYLVFKNGFATVYCKILNLAYPEYSRILETKPTCKYSFSSKDLKKSISTLGGLSRSDIIVSCSPGDNGSMKMTIAAEKLNVSTAINFTFDGEKSDFKINGKDLKEAFSYMSSDTCSIYSIQNKIYLFKDESGYVFMGSFCK